jgi:hypothetical protein
MEAERALCGHVLASPDGRQLRTTGIDLQTRQSLVGVRDAATLEKPDRWPTHGMDAHEWIWNRGAASPSASPGDRSKPTRIAANGGVPTTAPETGRVKRGLEGMRSSLVRLRLGCGELMGQWRLDDPRQILRHLA